MGTDAKRSQAAEVAGCPGQTELGPLGRGHRVAVHRRLGQPGWDLHGRHGVQIWHEGWVLDASWAEEEGKRLKVFDEV